MNTPLALLVTFSACYVYYVVFLMREFIIEKTKNMLIYQDQTFTNRDSYTRGDWDSLNHEKSVRRRIIWFTIWKHAVLIFCLPVFGSMNAALEWGLVPADATTSTINAIIMAKYIAACYVFALIVFIFHWRLLRKYKQKAELDKATTETKEILRGRKF